MNQNKALELTKDIATDIIGGILIAVGVYNFAAAAKFPMEIGRASCRERV